MTDKVEILAPAGNLQRAKVAIQNGADAVYLGGKLFSARSSADNFEDEEIEEIVKYANVRGSNVYLAVNTLMKENELNEAITYIEKMYNIGVNAFIFQDIGLATYVKKQLPQIIMHGSTQLFAHSLKDVEVMKEAGFSRVVLARELSISEIKHIKENIDIEIEVFVHGALCVCYSGQCLMSAMIGDRSGNRGKCAQSCRMTYELYEKDNSTKIKDGYLLSPKDIMAVEIIDQYIEAGVDSLKIEGRMKNEKYVAQIVKGYREKVDNISKDLDLKTLKNMQQIFNRGGSLIQGYGNSYSGETMMSVETPKSTGLYLGEVLDYKDGKAKIKLADDVVPGDGIEIWTKIKPNTGTNLMKQSKAGEIVWITIAGKISKGDKVYKSFDKVLDDSLKAFKETKQKTITASIEAKISSPLKLTLSHNGIVVEVKGDIVDVATNTPTTKEVVIEKLSKTGGTPYKFNFENVDIDDNIFVSIKGVNELKREAIEKFIELEENNCINNGEIKTFSPSEKIEGTKMFAVEIVDSSYLKEVIDCGTSKIVCQLNKETIANIESNFEYIKKCGVELFLKLPKVTLNDDEIIIDGILKESEKIHEVVAGFEICNYGEYQQVKKYNKKISGSYNFTVYNNATKDYLCNDLGFETVTLSPELNLQEVSSLADGRCEALVYGKIDMMVTRQCPVGLYKANKNENRFCSLKGKDNKFYLKDRLGVDFDLVTNCDYCNCTILNSSTIFLIDKWSEIGDLNVEYFRLCFTTEEKELVLSVINAYIEGDETIKDEVGKVTNGHYYRGVL